MKLCASWVQGHEACFATGHPRGLLIKPAAFDYERPETIAELVGLLAQLGPDATMLAGGQSLVPMLALRLARPAVLIDLNRIRSLAGIEIGKTIRIGAMTRQATILNDPCLATILPAFAAVTRYIGHYQTRCRGTIGGSLSLCDPAAEYPAFALAMDAEVELVSHRGMRRVAMADFIVGPYMTVVEPDEVMVAVHFAIPHRNTRVMIDEIFRRPGDFALVGLVARVETRWGRIRNARISWLGAAGSAVRSIRTEAALEGQRWRGLNFDDVGADAIAELELKTDLQASADYRRRAGRNLAARLLRAMHEKVL